MKILFFGDIYGQPGRKAIRAFLPDFIQKNSIDIVLANCENTSDGKGITEKSAKELFSLGIDAFSGGNHLWDRKEALSYLELETRIAKPLNFPELAPGFNYVLIEKNELKLILISLCGQSFMSNVDSPFYALERILPEFHEITSNIIIDFHAESTAEKRTLGFYFNGKVSAVLGTHTHIQTADEEIMDQGTAYITDVGMTGPHDSVIGVKKEIAIYRAKTGLPVRHETAVEGLMVNAVIVNIDENTGKASDIIRIREYL